MTTRQVPPLPDPVNPPQQTSENRRVMSLRFIIQARDELAQGNRLQAGEKAWGAIAQQLKIVGQERGWRHSSHQQLEGIGRIIIHEYPDLAPQQLVEALTDAYRVGHENFYENMYDAAHIEEMLGDVERELPRLEQLVAEASSNPRPMEITSNALRRNLRVVTGDNTLQLGDKSEVGFSRRHGAGGEGDAVSLPP